MERLLTILTICFLLSGVPIITELLHALLAAKRLSRSLKVILDAIPASTVSSDNCLSKSWMSLAEGGKGKEGIPVHKITGFKLLPDDPMIKVNPRLSNSLWYLVKANISRADKVREMGLNGKFNKKTDLSSF